jgi:hypothetical protein
MHFDREGKPISLLEWGRLFKDPAYSIVRQSMITDMANPAASFTVCTDWVGLDSGFGSEELPLIFRTRTAALIRRSELGNIDESDITDTPDESPVNPEQAVIDAIDELERDEIDDIVDWQIEQGRKRGDGPGRGELLSLESILAALESLLPGRDGDDEAQMTTLDVRSYATLEEAREGHRQVVLEVASALGSPMIVGVPGAPPGMPRKSFKWLREGLILRHCDGRCAACRSLHPRYVLRAKIWAVVAMAAVILRLVVAYAMPTSDLQAGLLSIANSGMTSAFLLFLLMWRFRETTRPLKGKD